MFQGLNAIIFNWSTLSEKLQVILWWKGVWKFLPYDKKIGRNKKEYAKSVKYQ